MSLKLSSSAREKIGQTLIVVFIIMAVGGLALVFDSLAGPTCSLQTHEVRVDNRPTMLAVIRQDTVGTSDLPTDFLVHTMKDLNPDIDPGDIRPSTVLVVPDECTK